MKSISNQILASILVSLFVVVGGWIFFRMHGRGDFEKARLVKNQINAAERLAHYLSDDLLNHDLSNVKDHIKIEASDENILSIQVFDKNGKFYTGTIRENGILHDISDKHLQPLHEHSTIRPVLYQGTTIGKVVIYNNKKPFQLLVKRLKTRLFTELLSLIIIMTVVLYLVLKMVVIKPLTSLTDWVSSIDSDKKALTSESFHSNEINTISAAVSSMTERLIASHKEILDKNKEIIERDSHLKLVEKNFTSGVIYQFIINKDGIRKFTHLSNTLKDLYDITPEEIIADASIAYNRVHKDDIESIMKAEEEALKTLRPYRKDFRVKDPSGDYRWCYLMATPTLLEDGSIRIDGIQFDIDDLKSTQKDLQYNQYILQSILKETTDLVFIKDIQGRYLALNKAAEKFIGKKSDDILDNGDNALFPFEKTAAFLDNDRKVMESGITETFVQQMKTDQGSRTFLATKGPVKDESGKVTGMFGISRDITDLKLIEDELQASKQKFAMAFNSSPDAILISELQTGQIIDMNQAAVNLFGYTKEEAIGKTTKDLNLYKNPEDRQRVLEAVQAKGAVNKMELTGQHKSGRELTVLLSIEKTETNGESFLITSVHDITERKLMEVELQKLNLSKDRFMSIIGHDLRGPFNGILGILDLLNNNIQVLTTEETEEFLAMALKSAKNASELLDDILLWATAQSGKISFEPQNVPIKEECSRVVELLQSTFDAKNIAIQLNADDDLRVSADKNMLDTILRNLISNALKFTSNGGKITVSAERTPNNVVVSVADNGIGIATADLPKIFDKTLLFTSYGTADEKGTGFGLKLCQDFVEKHGGKIWVESQVAKGTTFYFSLPSV